MPVLLLLAAGLMQHDMLVPQFPSAGLRAGFWQAGLSQVPAALPSCPQPVEMLRLLPVRPRRCRDGGGRGG